MFQISPEACACNGHQQAKLKIQTIGLIFCLYGIFLHPQAGASILLHDQYQVQPIPAPGYRDTAPFLPLPACNQQDVHGGGCRSQHYRNIRLQKPPNPATGLRLCHVRNPLHDAATENSRRPCTVPADQASAESAQ